MLDVDWSCVELESFSINVNYLPYMAGFHEVKRGSSATVFFFWDYIFVGGTPAKKTINFDTIFTWDQASSVIC